MQLPDVFPHLAIVGERSIAEGIGQTKTVIGFGDGGGGSLQTFVFPIEFVDQYELLGCLHQFCRSKLPRTDSTGGSRALRKPPFCKILRFVCSEVFLFDSALKSYRFRRKFVI